MIHDEKRVRTPKASMIGGQMSLKLLHARVVT